MRTTIKASMTAILLSSVVLVPAATVVTFASADAAFAKSDKAGGKGRGNSGAAKEKARGKSRSKSGGKSASSRSQGGGLGGLFDKLTGKDRNATRTAKASGKPAKGSGMHPSELGNMNGALNANINAVLAHIRNGNTNGPVGHLAAIAVSADGAIGAQDLLDQEAEFQLLGDLLSENGYTSLDEYYADRNGIDPIAEIDDAAAAIAVLDAAGTDPSDPAYVEAVEALETALGDNEYGDLGTYETDVAGDGGTLEVDDAIAALGGDAAGETDLSDTRPSEEDVVDATDALDAQGDAEADILAYWNKNDDDPSVVTEQEQALLDKLYERLEGNEDAIADAIGEPEVDDELIDDVVDCEGLEECTDDDDMAELTE